MATVARARPLPVEIVEAPVVVLEDVPWEIYERLRDADANYHVRMVYDDGRLELMSPSYRHEISSRGLAHLIRVLTMTLGIPCQDAGSTTLRRKGKGPKRGQGKEPDTCFYLANEPRMRGKKSYTQDVDPPPDLAIEVEVSYRSERSLRIYAKLGVPEVWRYDGRTLWIGQLRGDGGYVSCKRSPALPMLTQTIVLGWMNRMDEVGESQGLRELAEWVRNEMQSRNAGRKKR